eukprot:7753-Amphidinium_carterae.1
MACTTEFIDALYDQAVPWMGPKWSLLLNGNCDEPAGGPWQMGTGAFTDLLLPWMATGASPTFVEFMAGQTHIGPCSEQKTRAHQSHFHPFLRALKEHMPKPGTPVCNSSQRHRAGQQDFVLKLSSLNARSLLEPGKLLYAAKQLLTHEIH